MRCYAMIMAAGLFFLLSGVAVAYEAADAFARIKLSAEAGDAQAQANLGQRYIDGKGVKQDFTQAAAWLQKATDQKQPDAALTLGKMTFMGKGVAMNRETAAKDWTIAAEAGNISAPALVGRYYFMQGFRPAEKKVIRTPAIKALYWSSIGAKEDPSQGAREYSAKIVGVMQGIDPSLQSEVDTLLVQHKFPQ